MAIIQNLVAMFKADSTAFERGTNRAKNSLRSMMTETKAFHNQLTTLARRLLTAGGVAGFGYLIKRQMDTIDTTTKLSDRLGITTEALVDLQHGAKISGVETETLNKLLEIFSRRLGEVQMGTAEAKRALESLGLSSKELVGIDMDKAISIIADQINKLGTQSEKAAAANYLFGRSGQQLLNLFEKGSEGIEEFRKETEKLGLSFDRIDAAKIEMANDALNRTRAVFTGLMRRTTIELAPYIEATAQAFVNFATQGEGVGVNVTNAMESISLSIVNLIENVERGIISLNRLRHPIESLEKEMEARSKAMERFKQEQQRPPRSLGAVGIWGGQIPAEAIKQTIEDTAKYTEYLNEELVKVGLRATDAESSVRKAFDKIRADAQAKAEAFVAKREARKGLGFDDEELKNQAENIASIYARMYADISDYGNEYQQWMIKSLNEQIEKYKEAGVDIIFIERWKQNEIIKIQEDATEKQRRYLEEQRKRAIEQAKEIGTFFEGFGAGIAQMERELQTIGELGADIGQNLRDGLVDSLTDAVFEAKNLGDAMREVSREIAKMAFKWSMQQLVTAGMDALKAGIGSLFTRGPQLVPSVVPEAAITLNAHKGGIVGQDYFPTRIVPVPLFAKAPRLHSGLRADEYPAILQRGETVIPRSNKDFQPVIKIRNVIVRDEKAAYLEAMNSADGEKVILQKVARNRRLLG